MPIDYIVSSLQPLTFDGDAPYTWDEFLALMPGGSAPAASKRWTDLETQLRNAMAAARNGAKYMRRADGCSLYWKNRITACFTEKDVAKRQDLIDRVWWDAAGELTPPESPLGKGALATYAVRLKTAIRRSAASKEKGNAAFDRLTEDTKLTF